MMLSEDKSWHRISMSPSSAKVTSTTSGSEKSCFLHRMNDSSKYCWQYLPRLQSPLSRHMTWKNFVLRRLKALCYRQSLYLRLHICRYRVWHLTRERIFRQRRWQSVRHHNNCRDSAHRHHQNLMYHNCHHSPQDYICRFLSPLNPYHRLLPCRHRNWWARVGHLYHVVITVGFVVSETCRDFIGPGIIYIKWILNRLIIGL